MSNRSLIEINHDFTHDIEKHRDAFLRVLGTYLRSADRETAEALEMFGVRVVGMRHHSGNFVLDGVPDGFPVTYLTPSRAEIAKGQG